MTVSDNPSLPRLLSSNSGAPAAPVTPEHLDIELEVLSDLALKLANTVPRLTQEWAVEQLCVPPSLVERILWQLRDDQFLEILGQNEAHSYRYAITQRGRDYAARLLEISGYIGPAPVTLESYTAMLDWQLSRFPAATPDRVKEAISELVLPPEVVENASLAASSRRSLFLYGPPGNGKTSLGRALHKVLWGDLWIPHCIAVGSQIIRIYDEQMHQRLPDTPEAARVDKRWIRVARPFIMAGGEMTLSELDLAWSPALRFYEAPPHVKANGGLFLLDDFGRQQVDPHSLLNRWIIPLERQIDHLTLASGQKIRVPFRLLLIVATNLNLPDVADPAFLRRMGYRVFLDKPTPQRWAEIFRRAAASVGVEPSGELINKLLDRYIAEGRDLRASEPRDLIERLKDICALRRQPLRLDEKLLDLAWTGYFGNA